MPIFNEKATTLIDSFFFSTSEALKEKARGFRGGC